MVNDEAVSSGVRLQHNTSYSLLLLLLYYQGRNHGRKVEGGGGKVWVPTPKPLHPTPGKRPGWVLGAVGGRPRPLPL